MIMNCIYFSFLFLLTFCDAIQNKRNFDPDTLMYNMMFTNNDKTQEDNGPTVFSNNWGFYIHNPFSYLGQYSVDSNSYTNNQNNEKEQGNTSEMKHTKSAIKEQQDAAENKNSQKVGEQTSAGTQGFLDMNKSGYGFNPNNLFSQLMHMSSGVNSYDMLKGKTKTNKMENKAQTESMNKGTVLAHQGQNTDSSVSASRKTEGTSLSSMVKQMSTNKDGTGFNADELNKQMMGNFGKTDFSEHGSINKLSSGGQNREQLTSNFDPTDLNSKMFSNIGYNPVYVQMDSKRRQRKRQANEFVSGFNGGQIPQTYGSSKDANAQVEEFNPNANQFTVAQTNWGLSIYNPQGSLEQYSGSNTDQGVVQPVTTIVNTNTAQTDFDPDTLNSYLMSLLKQKMSSSSQSTMQQSSSGYNFNAAGFNPVVTNAQFIQPMIQANVQQLAQVHNENITHRNSLSESNGYVKNIHGLNQNGYEAVSHSGHSDSGNGYVAVHNQNSGSLNNNMVPSKLNSGNNNQGGYANNISGGNTALQTNTGKGNAVVTGIGSLGGAVLTNGNGYTQAKYQMGPAQGIMNNTSVLMGNGGTVTQTQAGGLGTNTVQQTGFGQTTGSGSATGNAVQIGTGNGNAVQTNTLNTGTGGITQTTAGGLGSTSVNQIGAGQAGAGGLGSNVVAQTAAGSLGSNSVTQTGTGGLGLNTQTQTGGQGSLGSNTVSQSAAGSLGSTSVAQTGGAGSLGSNTIAQTGGAGSLGSNTVSQTAAGSLGSASVAQTGGAGSLGSNAVIQTSTGGLGSVSVSQTGVGSLGSTSVGQTAAGGLGSTSVSQSGSGTLGSNSVQQTNAGSLGSNSVSQTGAGSLGTSSGNNGQTGAGSLGSNTVNQSAVGSLG